jgi:uncharacterized SAM-binding protein YcdF (DUF218 family)
MTYLHLMFPILLAVLAIGLVARKQRRGLLFLKVGLAALFLWSWPPFSWLISNSLEWPYRTTPGTPLQNAEAIVVLSGGIYRATPSQPEPLPKRDTYVRCQHAAWIYHHQKQLPVIVSGGRAPGNVFLARIMRQVLEANGVPSEAIETEEQSTSTYENALYTSPLLRRRGIHHIALVTEGYHMLRAELAFRKQGFGVEAAPCNLRIEDFRFDVDEFLPGSGAIHDNEEALHEWVGMFWYRLRGRI